MPADRSKDVQGIAWNNHEKTLAKALLESIALRHGGPVNDSYLSRRTREVMEAAAEELGYGALAVRVWDELVTDTNGHLGGSDAIVHGRFTFDPVSNELSTPYSPDPVTFTALEGRIFKPLISTAGKVVTYDRLVDLAWRYSEAGTSDKLKAHISHMRDKIANGNPEGKGHLQSRTGIGYVFGDPAPKKRG